MKVMMLFTISKSLMLKMMMRMTIMGEVCRKLSLQRTLVAKKSFSTTMSTVKTAAATVLDDDDTFPFQIVFLMTLWLVFFFYPPMTPFPWDFLRFF